MLLGAGLVLGQTAFMALADAITKMLTSEISAPQLFAVSSAIILIGLLPKLKGQTLQTGHPVAMGLRAGLTVVASVAFFRAFALLPWADVFLFVALIPLATAALGGVLLNEPPRPQAWLALVLGALGVATMVPGGLGALQPGHGWAALASVAGAVSLMAGRYIGRNENRPLAQVFWPNLALLAAMTLALPWVWQPMGLADLGMVATYAAALFVARYMLAEALRLLSAHLVTPLMNLQFLWMAGLGWVLFADVPGQSTVLGMALIAASSLWLVTAETRARPAQA